MTTLLSFHSDKKVKAKYVKRLREHHKADEIIKGLYWENGKGCAVGCTIHSGDHNAYETELGLPEWLARLEDALFEGLPNGRAKDFAKDFLSAIPIGVNLEPVKWRFCSLLMQGNLDRVEVLGIPDGLKSQVIEAIRQCKKVNDYAAESGEWNESAARSARSAAWSAWSAARSAEAAAWSAEAAAWSAASAAESAASDAESAARSAVSAAVSAARSAESAAFAAVSAAVSAAYIQYADALLKLLEQAA